MKTLDYIAVQDKDDPPYISLGHGFILGTQWEAQIFLGTCKAKGGLPPRKTLTDKSCCEVWFCCVAPCVCWTGWELWQEVTLALLGRWHRSCWGLPGAELPPPVLPGCPSSMSPQGRGTSPGISQFSLFLGKGAGAGGYSTFCAPDPTPAASSWCHCPGVTAQWPHTCPSPIQPSPEQDDGPTRARGGLNVFAMHSSAQHPQKVPSTNQAPKSHQTSWQQHCHTHTHRNPDLRKSFSVPTEGWSLCLSSWGLHKEKSLHALPWDSGCTFAACLPALLAAGNMQLSCYF